MEERSLDEFFDTPEESAGVDESDDEEGVDEREESTEMGDEREESTEMDDGPDENDPPETPGEGVEPASATSRWTPEGEPCEACGETATRLWNADGDLVCQGCKQW